MSKKTHGTKPVSNGRSQCERVVDNTHLAPCGAILSQLQYIGQPQQEVAQRKKIHAHLFALQTLADEQKHDSKAQ